MNSLFFIISLLIISLLISVALINEFFKDTEEINPGLATDKVGPRESGAGKPKKDSASKVGWVSRILRTILGFLVCVAVMSVWTGGSFSDVIGAVMIFMVCTVGVGGVFIVALSYMVGTTIVSAFSFSKGGRPLRSILVQTENISSAIQDYVAKAKQAGLSPEKIEKNLLEAGWSADVIKQSLKNAEESSKTEY